MAKRTTKDTTDQVESDVQEIRDELEIISDILHGLLTAHGETYAGALAHLDELTAARKQREDEG
jgi:hypothetical protein